MIRLGRLEIAWIILLLSTLSIGTLSATEAITGEVRQAQLLRGVAVLFVISLCVPNIKKAINGSGRSIYLGYGSALLFVYIAIACFSIAWTASFIVTAGKSLELVAALLVVSSIAAQPSPEKNLINLFKITIAFILSLLIIIALGYIINPDLFSRTIRMTGDSILSGGALAVSSNAISRYGAYIGLYFLAVLLFMPQKKTIAIALVIALILFGVSISILSHGRTGIAAMTVGAVVLFSLRKPLLGIISGLVLAPVSFMVFPEFWIDIIDFLRRGQTDEMVLGLSGRVDWWGAGLDAYREKWFTGYGYGIGSRVAFLSIGVMNVSGAHNGIIEVFLGIGLVGGVVWLALLLIFLWRSAVALIQLRNPPYMIASVPLLFATILSSGTGGWWSPELGLFFILIFIQDMHTKAIRRKQKINFDLHQASNGA
jgi:hypothetical protein